MMDIGIGNAIGRIGLHEPIAIATPLMVTRRETDLMMLCNAM